MLIPKREHITVATATFLLLFLCLAFNKISYGTFIVHGQMKEQTELLVPLYVPEDVAVTEEKKQLEYKKNDTEVYSTSTLHVPIFVYHSVRPYIEGESKSQDAYDVTPELFEKQLQYLKDNNYEVITMDTLDALFTKGIATNDTKKRVVLSFDDGWENQYTYAYPLLKKFGVSGMFYVYTRPLGYKHFLTWEQIIEMKNSGMEIGSHTLTHPFFKKVDDTQLTHEISDSKKEIEEKIGSPVLHFASPFGYTNAHIEEFIKKAGYHTGRTIFWGALQSNQFSLRGNLVTDDMNDFIKVLQEK